MLHTNDSHQIRSSLRHLLLVGSMACVLVLAAGCDSKKEDTAKPSASASKATPTAKPAPTATPTSPAEKASEEQVEKALVKILGEMEQAGDFVEWFDLRVKLLSKGRNDPRVEKAIESRLNALLEARPNKKPAYYNISDEVEILGMAFEVPGETNAEKARTNLHLVVKANGPLAKDCLFSVIGMVDAQHATMLASQADQRRSGALWLPIPAPPTTRWEKDSYYKISLTDDTLLQTTYTISIGMQENKDGHAGIPYGRRVFIGPMEMPEK